MKHYTQKRTYETKRTIDVLKMLAIIRKLADYKETHKESYALNHRRHVKAIETFIKWSK